MRINPEALRTIRTDRSVTLNELAGIVGCQASHLCNVEAGRREASPKLIRALADALRIPLLSILGPEDRVEAVKAS